MESKHFRLINPLNAELSPICYLLALLGAHHILHVSRVRVKVTARFITFLSNHSLLLSRRLIRETPNITSLTYQNHKRDPTPISVNSLMVYIFCIRPLFFEAIGTLRL